MAHLGDQPLRSVTALVVDDNHHMRVIVNTILRSLGCTDVRECPDGVSAFEALRVRACHLIILDLRMDTLDGLDFVRLLRRSSDSPCPAVPIIMMTGHSEHRYVIAARDAGVTEFIAKPISAHALYTRIISALDAPRAFIKGSNYVGPNRRRRSNADYSGPDRRDH